MSESNFCILLMRDAATQVIASPGASHCWHRLKDAYQRVDNEQEKKELLAELLAHTPGEGMAGFLRATWLVSVLNNDALLADAGRILLDIVPFDPDRMVSFLLFSWARILDDSSGRAAFSQAVCDAHFPAILHSLGRHLAQKITIRPPARTIERVQKIALVTPYLSGYSHAPTATALHQARILREQGMEVALFSCLDLVAPGMANFLGAGESAAMPAFDATKWSLQCPPGMLIYQGSEQFSVMTRWTEMLTHIAAFDPDLVMSVGFYSPLVAPLHEARPTLGLNIHSVAPLDPVDVWLCAAQEDAGKVHTQWGDQPWNGRPSGCIGWHHPYRVQRKPPASVLSRQTLGLSDTALVLISVGCRLDMEICGVWATRMTEILRCHPDVIWLLVGGAGTMPPALAQASASQIRTFRTHDDIPAVLQQCDIYVNPPRMGGGFSVAEAMAEGLPVVTYNDSDGGHKAGDAAVGNDTAYFEKLAGLIASADLRQHEGAAMQALFSATLDLDKSGPGLIAACELARERFSQRFHQRITPATS